MWYHWWNYWLNSSDRPSSCLICFGVCPVKDAMMPLRLCLLDLFQSKTALRCFHVFWWSRPSWSLLGRCSVDYPVVDYPRLSGLGEKYRKGNSALLAVPDQDRHNVYGTCCRCHWDLLQMPLVLLTRSKASSMRSLLFPSARVTLLL